MQEKVILFAILNWGLGHASRSIPLIRYLQSKNYKLIICTDGHVVSFLEKELDNVLFEYLPPYDISYRYDSMALNMALQIPKIYATYRKEKQVFGTLVDQYNPFICISDNRYGCITQSVPSYFIGHQWNILQSNKTPHRLASKVNQFMIRKFYGYLIPDKCENSLSGILTKNVDHPNTHWLGLLSRFSSIGDSNQEEKYYRFLAILSGPEPARTNFEIKIIDYCKAHADLQFAIVRGTEKPIEELFPTNCLCHNIVEKSKLEKLISKSQVIIGRSGYSSVMDYISLGLKKIIFIPTPGQTEQEYLAERLSKQAYAFKSEKSLTNESLRSILDKIEKENNVITTNLTESRTYKEVLNSIIEEHILENV